MFEPLCRYLAAYSSLPVIEKLFSCGHWELCCWNLLSGVNLLCYEWAAAEGSGYQYNPLNLAGQLQNKQGLTQEQLGCQQLLAQ